MTARTTLLVGTTKGLFLLTSTETRSDWTVSGPHCDLWTINHAVGTSHSDEIWAAGGNAWSGAGVWASNDSGATWSLTKLANGEADAWARDNPEDAALFGMSPAPDAPYDGEIDAIWSLCPAHGTLYAGSKPANLYQSADGGATWTRFAGLADFPGRDAWQPGAAGLTLHTIVPHPDDPLRLWVGISAAGVFATETGGADWERRIRRDNSAPHTASDHPAWGSDTEIGGCVHNMQIAQSDGAVTLYQQNHHGVYRSLDGARSWQDITAGLPSTFGFPIAVHPFDPEMVWCFPLNGDSAGRYPPDAKAAVWRSADGGTTWTAQTVGLPRENCFFTVLRQAMCVDQQPEPGVYFGTNSGSVFASLDTGETWREIAAHLPTVLSVESVTRR
ncbi:exo-alpha-sialidase [Marivita sp. S6314]|uniref:WD40/YVTN/BNR-like repeat-containing protein n=1 Tax=Marivita sp. S6314 TaxID=2926406 RepID=UPI001FF46D57|nr:exo-alpha-sialidase [Marivita sp. S6314]MCK0148395.1 exo-alpha-sialidase [Marivita sp. S6314]